MAVIVVYGGGFQPFHQGHLSSYLEAKKAFPNADFYVASSDSVSTRPIPFLDKKFLAVQAGVQPEDFPDVVVQNPLNPKEILEKYNPDTDILIVARSERDPVPYVKKDGTPAYYQPFVNIKKCRPFKEHGYIFVTKKHDFKINGNDVYSGTQVRELYQNADDNGRIKIISQMYPNSQKQDIIKNLLDKYIGVPFVKPAKPKKEKVIKTKQSPIKKLQAKNNSLNEDVYTLIRKARPLLKEASIEKKLEFLKLLKEINFFKLGKKIDKPEEVPNEPEDEKTLGYDYLFKPKEPVKPQPKVYPGWDAYEKDMHDKDEKDVEEAKLHFTDPNARINVYYIPPTLHRQGKIQNLAHNIPYKLLEPFINALVKKYVNINPEYITWHNVANDPNSKYGEKISESKDYLDEK